MTGQVCKIPCNRSIRQRDNVGKIDQRDVIQFSTSNTLGL
ncbi:Uncharacterised protein [Mycobacterium tuberculosis]|nr:Uncharacterised protein [Mycobacterium tuberculosis]